MLAGLAQAGRLAPSRPEVVVALGQLVDAEYRRVDLLLDREDFAGAIAALEGLRTQSWPTREEGGDLSVELRHDVYGRLLRLRLDNPDVDPLGAAGLLALAEEGLGAEWSEVEHNPFTARLLAEKGEILESLERDDDALSSYEQALEINRVLLDRELSGGAP
jgi:tetratricopeptide (TPR) repeat protein